MPSLQRFGMVPSVNPSWRPFIYQFIRKPRLVKLADLMGQASEALYYSYYLLSPFLVCCQIPVSIYTTAGLVQAL
jgi:hypothetical protein